MTTPIEIADEYHRDPMLHVQDIVARCKRLGTTTCERCQRRIAAHITRNMALCAGCSPDVGTVAEAARRLAAVMR